MPKLASGEFVSAIAMTDDGYLKTGDLGEMDADGCILPQPIALVVLEEETGRALQQGRDRALPALVRFANAISDHFQR